MASKPEKDGNKEQSLDTREDSEVISCPFCAFFKVLAGTDVKPVYEKSKRGGKEKKTRSPKSRARTGGARAQWGDFEETVKSAYLKSTRKNRKDIADFDESSEHIIPDGLTDFIEDEEKKRPKAKGKF